MAGLSLAETSWPAIGRRGAAPTLVVPLGSCEQHGPHLPFDVDSAVAQAVSARCVEGSENVVLGPTLGYGASGEHEAFPGTVSIGTEALTTVLLELGRSATRWAARVLFVTGHGGNVDALVAACTRLRSEGRDCAWWPCAVPGGDAHAGETETSLMLAIRPAVVSAAREAGATGSVTALMPALRLGGVRAVSPNGVLGDPRGATAEAGRVLLSELAARLAVTLRDWQINENGLAVTRGPA